MTPKMWKIILPAAVLCGVVMGFFLIEPNLKPSLESKKILPSKSVSQIEPHLEQEETTASERAAKEKESEVIEESLMPTLKVVRKEAEENPHSTPPSLIKFATALAAPMEAALKSESEAQDFFKYLHTCSMRPDLATSARASCVVNASQLKNKYKPKFDSQFEIIVREIPAGVLKLAKFTNGTDL